MFAKFSTIFLFGLIGRFLLVAGNEIDHSVFDAFKDILLSQNINTVVIVDGLQEEHTKYHMTKKFHESCITTILFSFNHADKNNSYFSYISTAMENSFDVTTLFLCEPCDCENLLQQLKNNKFIRRSLLYFFYWGQNNVTSKFKHIIEKSMKISTVTNPRYGVFRIYYNQASTKYENQLKMVNWWTGRLFSSPALPPADTVYNNFNGQIFKVPVFHAPPWHFVHQHNKSVIEVTGGRDHKLLILLAEKLNFGYEYFDPPDRSQGSGVGNNGSFKGVLGIIQRRVRN